MKLADKTLSLFPHLVVNHGFTLCFNLVVKVLSYTASSNEPINTDKTQQSVCIDCAFHSLYSSCSLNWEIVKWGHFGDTSLFSFTSCFSQVIPKLDIPSLRFSFDIKSHIFLITGWRMKAYSLFLETHQHMHNGKSHSPWQFKIRLMTWALVRYTLCLNTMCRWQDISQKLTSHTRISATWKWQVTWHLLYHHRHSKVRVAGLRSFPLYLSDVVAEAALGD